MLQYKLTGCAHKYRLAHKIEENKIVIQEK